MHERLILNTLFQRLDGWISKSHHPVGSFRHPPAYRFIEPVFKASDQVKLRKKEIVIGGDHTFINSPLCQGRVRVDADADGDLQGI